jgi:hypothetical protein
MWTTIGMRDVTSYVAPDSEDNGSLQGGGLAFSAKLNDPATTWSCVVDDIDQTLNIQNFMPVVIWDETQPALAGVPTVPSMNFALNPIFLNDGFGHAPASWSQVGTLPGSVWSYPQEAVVLTLANNANAQYALQEQTLGLGYVVAGQEYMLSIYMTGSGTIVGFQTLLELTFFDIDQNSLTPVTIDQRIPLPGQHHLSIAAVAPAGAVSAELAFGGITTSGTNSGAVTFGTIQFEPMWFADKGVSYPTPDCNVAQVNSVVLPDGTTSRKCRLFAGYVENHINVYVGGERHTAIQCASSSKLLETAGLISASYTNTQDTTILADALSQLPANAPIIGQLSTGQQNFFSPASTLIAGVVVDSISFADATMREVANGVSGQSGSLFYVDPYYYPWYVPPSFVGTVVELSDTPDGVNSFPYDNFTVEYDSTNPVNYVRVKGTKQQAAAITDTFSGNGSTTVFNLTEPPFTTHTVTVAGNAQRTGIDGVDNAKFGVSLTFKALINKQAQTIRFAAPPASGTNNVIVTYTYEDQVIADVLAADAIAEQRGLQCWGLVSDSNITSTIAAKHRGLTELQDYAEPRIILTLSSLGIYLPVGSLILFTCQSENMSRTPFVVQTVDAEPLGAGLYHWNYTAGVYQPTVLDHLRNVGKAVKKTPTTANVVVVSSIDVALFDSVHLDDTIVVNAASAGPYTYGSAKYGFALYA